MRLSWFWKAGAVAAVVGVVALIAVACAGAPAAAPTLIVDANTVSGSAGAPNVAGACVLTSRFKPGNSIVWRVKVYDPVTGKTMDDKVIKSIEVKLPDGQAFLAKYGGHPGGASATPTDYFWTTAWVVPDSYPTGSLAFTITATSTDGRTGKFTEFNVAPSLLTIVK